MCWSKHSEFFLIKEIWTFPFQNSFHNHFWTSGNGQIENTRKYGFACFCVFSVWPFPELQNWFWKQFWNQKVHISIVKKIWSVMTNKKKLKIGFPIVFSNLEQKGLGFFFFMLECKVFHQTPCIYLPNSHEGHQTSVFDLTH